MAIVKVNATERIRFFFLSLNSVLSNHIIGLFKINAMAKAYIKGDIIETPLENTAFIVGMLFNAK